MAEANTTADSSAKKYLDSTGLETVFGIAKAEFQPKGNYMSADALEEMSALDVQNAWNAQFPSS